MTLGEFNEMNEAEKAVALRKCCGSGAWVKGMIKSAPYAGIDALMQTAEDVWEQCHKVDYLEAFAHHPKIGDLDSLRLKFPSTKDWASGEQSGVNAATESTLLQLQKGNEDYEKKFGFIFIVFATGKSAEEMNSLLQLRLQNRAETELHIAKTEQMKITRLRLEKLLSQHNVIP